MCLPKRWSIIAYRNALLCRAFSRGCAVTSNRSRLQAERKCSKPPCIAGRLSLCGQRGFMDKLQKCAKAFEKLLEIQYRIIIGRKGKTVELVIGFSKLDFHHLMGLGKLKDLRITKSWLCIWWNHNRKHHLWDFSEKPLSASNWKSVWTVGFDWTTLGR